MPTIIFAKMTLVPREHPVRVKDCPCITRYSARLPISQAKLIKMPYVKHVFNIAYHELAVRQNKYLAHDSFSF